MAYIGPKDFSQDALLIAELVRVMSGDLKLEWMKDCPHPIAVRPKDPRRGLTLDDINADPHYGPAGIPEIIRHNFSMTPRGGVLPEGLPSLGYRVNRKSDVWADAATVLFEESKSRGWAPARNVPWDALDDTALSPEQDLALRQLCTGLTSIGLVAADVPARWVWQMNQEFHEIKFWLCAQMLDATRMAEAFRKRALYGRGALGRDSRELGELLKIIQESATYPLASAAMNLGLFSFVLSLGRRFEFLSTNLADTYLGTRLMQDASRFVAYGVDHLRQFLHARPAEIEVVSDHLDFVEGGLVGHLGSRELIEPLIVLSGGVESVAAFYRKATDEYFERCAAAGLGARQNRSPLEGFLKLLES